MWKIPIMPAVWHMTHDYPKVFKKAWCPSLGSVFQLGWDPQKGALEVKAEKCVCSQPSKLLPTLDSCSKKNPRCWKSESSLSQVIKIQAW